MNQTVQKKKVLVAGSGLLGVAAVEKFLSAGWEVVGVSLRKPELRSGREIEFPWNQIVAKYDLRSRNMQELVGHGDQHADFAFAYGAPEGPQSFVSTIKLRQAGFTKTIDTEQSFRNALQSLMDRKLLPPAAGGEGLCEGKSFNLRK